MNKSKAVPNGGRKNLDRSEVRTIAEASKETGLSRFWFYSRMANGTLPFEWIMPSPGKRFIIAASMYAWWDSSIIPAGKMPGE